MFLYYFVLPCVALINVRVLCHLLSNITFEIKNKVCDEGHSLNILPEVANYYYSHLWNERNIQLGAMFILHIRSHSSKITILNETMRLC